MFNKDKLEALMREKGWSKYKLANEAHLGQSTIHEILSGKKKSPTAKTLSKLADALGVSINEFFDEDDNSKNTEEINIPQEYLKQYKVTSRDKKQFLEYMKKVNEAFFMNDEFDEEDKKEILDTMNEIFWKAKAMNKRKPKQDK